MANTSSLPSPLGGGGGVARTEEEGARDHARECAVRTEMRQRTLELWLNLRNQRVKLALHGGVEACGVFQAVDAKHENLVISSLDSGIGVVPVALVRWSDVLCMETVEAPPTPAIDAGGVT
eukprot:CAMPEP_0197588656 /NCGR_PEP_ID=MMETSP1326-20131121/9858_1 /TAXON_ID=1155430 /ORGANISM="Genus nov. species nov., Strain RCC2288" /LENGTH=120 /DNA_ID=CAMNT_0043153503 /DNA_START=177 /DNA_END=539 /DNA_ORIENTATION=+